MAAGYGMALQAIAGGVDGAMDGIQQNALRKQMLGAYKNLPAAPDLQKAYRKGYEAQLEMTPRALKLEQKLRNKYLPQQMQLAANLYGQYLPAFAQTNLRALRSVDPQFLQGRQQLFETVAGDLALGSQLDETFRAELTDYLRGAQAARGNLLGQAPVAAEALYKGRAGQALKQQRIGNMEGFLRGPGPTDKFGQLAGTGASAAATGTAAAVRPGFSYVERPEGWGDAWHRAAGEEWQMRNAQAMARARNAASAPPKTNPWLTSLQGALNGLAGSMSAGGGGKK